MITILGTALATYSASSIAMSLIKFKQIYNAKLPFTNDNYTIRKVENVQGLEVYIEIENPPIYAGSPYLHIPIKKDSDFIFYGSKGKTSDTSYINHLYLGDSKKSIFICDLTKSTYEKLLKDHDQDSDTSYINLILKSNAHRRTFLHEIEADYVVSIEDKNVAFYHESQKYVAMYYVMQTRYPLTFAAGIIGGLLLFFN